MKSILLSSSSSWSSLVLPFPSLRFSPARQFQPPTRNCMCIPWKSHSHQNHSLLIVAALLGNPPPDEEGPVSVISFEDFAEKDWSFLDDSNSEEEKIRRIISSARVEQTSRVLVSIGSQGFVDRLVGSSPCSFVLVVHDSLLLLAGIKANHDGVKCWQGELTLVPQKWLPFDVVFLYFLPALPFKLHQLFQKLAKSCSPGARLVISHPQGRKVLEQQRKQHPDVIVSDLPCEMTLQKVAADHSFKMVDFVDEPGLYLAVLIRQETETLFM